jgi:DNA polymerase III epsilon subunit-like protein
MSYDPSKVAFIDTETTGLDPEHHVVWEIAVIVDGEEHVWQERLPRDWTAPGDQPAWATVDPWVVENTGIRERYNHETALHLADSMDRLVELTRGRHLVGACPWFDSERLHRTLLALAAYRGPEARQLPWHYHLIDVENLVVGYMRGQYSDEPDEAGPTKSDLPWKSEDLSRYVGVEPDDFKPKHSALADARWAKAMFEAVMGGPE